MASQDVDFIQTDVAAKESDLFWFSRPTNMHFDTEHFVVTPEPTGNWILASSMR